jgi:hypothetical protein
MIIVLHCFAFFPFDNGSITVNINVNVGGKILPEEDRRT